MREWLHLVWWGLSQNTRKTGLYLRFEQLAPISPDGRLLTCRGHVLQVIPNAQRGFWHTVGTHGLWSEIKGGEREAETEGKRKERHKEKGRRGRGRGKREGETEEMVPWPGELWARLQLVSLSP